METKEVFMNRLTELRKEKGVTRQIAADNLEISRASLEYYEKGLRNPDICVLARIAEYYNVSTDYLLGRSDVKTIDPDKRAASEITGLSEECINILMSNNSNTETHFASLISQFVIALYNNKFNLEFIFSLFDILLPNSQYKTTDTEFERLLGISQQYGYIVLSHEETIDYHKKRLQELVSSSAIAAFNAVCSEYFNENAESGD